MYLFLGSFALFALFLISNFLFLKLDFIADLSVSSYLLFSIAILFYFLQGQKDKWLLKLPFSRNIEITSFDIFKFAGILIAVFLIYPLTNAQIAAIIGYIVFLAVLKKSDGRYAFTIALFFLFLCPFLLLAQKDKSAEASAIFTYYFLAVGVAQEIVSILRNPPKVQDNAKEEKESIEDSIQIDFQRLINPLTVGLLSFVISFTAIYFIFNPAPKPIDVKPNISYKKIKTNLITPSPAIKEVKIKLASDAANLQIIVENGTKTPNLAASAKARLQAAGFTNISIGNADRKDYKKWELNIKKPDETLVSFIKQTLTLNSLELIEATAGAEYDLQLIIGEEK